MLYGAQYYRPPFPYKEYWKRDFANMKELGFNVVKQWAVWNRIEKVKGQYDFSELDELVSLAEDFGLATIINTIPEGAPYWVYSDDKGLYRTAEGKPVTPGGPANIPSAGWPGRCMDDPEFAELVADFIEATAAHFRNRKSVIAIDVWNEPHLEPMFDYRNDMLCYCEFSVNLFVNWLKDKYKTIENLNKAWFRNYTDFSQVTPPVRFGTWADMFDWRRFWIWNLGRWLRLRVTAAKRGAPNMKVQTHVAYSAILGNKLQGGLYNELGDEFTLAKEVDIFGLSSFPKWLMGPQNYYRHFITNEMVAQAANGKLFYQVELQGGAGKNYLLGGMVPNADDIRIWNYNTIAAGGKGSVYWQYAVEPAGIESPGFGLVGFDGRNTPRSLSASDCAKKLHDSNLDSFAPCECLNAVYVSPDTDLLCFSSERREEMYAGSISGVYKACYEHNIPVRFFHRNNVNELLDSGIKRLYLPMPLVLSEYELRIMKDFVEMGGVLISEACPALYDTSGLLNFESSWICNHNEIQGIEDCGEVAIIKNDGCRIIGRFYRQLIDLPDGCEILGRFEDGEPAIIERKINNGKVIWIGSFLGYEFEHTDHQATGDFIAGLFIPEGYSFIKQAKITGQRVAENGYHPEVVYRFLKSGNSKKLVIVNHSPESRTIHLTEGLRQSEIKVAGYEGCIVDWDLL